MLSMQVRAWDGAMVSAMGVSRIREVGGGGWFQRLIWRENEVRGQIMNQWVWFRLSGLDAAVFSADPSFSSVTQLVQKLLILSRGCAPPSWLAGQDYLGGSAARQQLLWAASPRLVAAQLGARPSTLWSPDCHWITEMCFSIISYKLLLCLRTKTKSVTNRGECCWNRRQKMQLLFIGFPIKEK